MNQQTQVTTYRQPSPILTARILTMVLQNGLATAMHIPRPHSVAALNRVRSQLLQDPFFDEDYRPDELAYRTRPGSISFMSIVVMMARLMRVLNRHTPLTEDELAERINVRNDCLNQPFFDRARVDSARPFVDDEDFEDEGCVILR